MKRGPSGHLRLRSANLQTYIVIFTTFRSVCPLGFSYQTQELTQNFELKLLFNPCGYIVLVPLTMTEYKSLPIVSIPNYLPIVGIEPATSWWFYWEALHNQTPISIVPLQGEFLALINRMSQISLIGGFVKGSICQFHVELNSSLAYGLGL